MGSASSVNVPEQHDIEGVDCRDGDPVVAPVTVCVEWLKWHRARKIGGKIDVFDLMALEEEWA